MGQRELCGHRMRKKMGLYFVQYEPHPPRRDVQPLSDALEELGAKRILDRTWALRYNSLSCEMLLDHLSYRIDVKDRLLVFKVSDWAACNALTRLNAI